MNRILSSFFRCEICQTRALWVSLTRFPVRRTKDTVLLHWSLSALVNTQQLSIHQLANFLTACWPCLPLTRQECCRLHQSLPASSSRPSDVNRDGAHGGRLVSESNQSVDSSSSNSLHLSMDILQRSWQETEIYLEPSSLLFLLQQPPPLT